MTMKQIRKNDRFLEAVTLLEMIVAMAIMAVILAAILPQFRAIQNSWASKQGNSEVLQNARVFTEHVNRHLSKATRITAVSSSTETNGHIEFENMDGNNLRYDIDGGYIQFGDLDLSSFYDLAGPVGSLTFACYDHCDLDTPMADINDFNDIRFVTAQAVFTNTSGLDKTITASAYIRTNSVTGSESEVVAWFELDDQNGLTASDSSGNTYNGTLTNMNGDEWTYGPVGGAIEFDGDNDIIITETSATQMQVGSDYTASVWIYTEQNQKPWAGIFSRCTASGDDNLYTLQFNNDTERYLTVYHPQSGNRWETNYTQTDFYDIWRHITIVYDSSSPTTKLYIDGELIDDTTSLTQGPGNENGKFHIGGERTATSSYVFKGKIDDLRIYNRVLGDSKIAELAGPWDVNSVSNSEFSAYNSETPALSKIDTTHYLCAVEGPGEDGWAVVLTIDSNDWSVSMETPFEFDNSRGMEPALAQIDNTHYLCAYRGPDNDGWAAVLEVDPSDWSISSGSAHEFDDSYCETPVLTKIDDNHYLCAYHGPDGDGWALVLEVDDSDWSISGTRSSNGFEFDTYDCDYPDLARIDDTHYLCVYEGWLFTMSGIGLILEVDTSDWSLSSTGGMTFDFWSGGNPTLAQIDEEHFLCAYEGVDSDGTALVLSVNTATWTINDETPLEYDTNNGRQPSLSQIDKSRYLCSYRGPNDDGWAVLLTVDLDNWTISGGREDISYEFDTSTGICPVLSKINDMYHLCVYEGPDNDGWSNVLNVAVYPPDPNTSTDQILP